VNKEQGSDAKSAIKLEDTFDGHITEALRDAKSHVKQDNNTSIDSATFLACFSDIINWSDEANAAMVELIVFYKNYTNNHVNDSALSIFAGADLARKLDNFIIAASLGLNHKTKAIADDIPF